MPKCIELLPCDWLISNLCYQAIEQVYLIKWPVSIYIFNLYIMYMFTDTCKIVPISERPLESSKAYFSGDVMPKAHIAYS